jgi:hypothetical protein
MSTHGPIDPEYKVKMNQLAKAIDEFWNGKHTGAERKIGFCILMFPFGANEPSKDRINYISNAERSDMITALKELIARFEGRDFEASDTKQ